MIGRIAALSAATFAAVAIASAQQPKKAEAHAGLLFKTADDCLACHNSLTTASGEDVSIGSSWRASMMANSSRDPYWQASVRRETMDHPAAAAAIEDECSICHMPMARTQAKAEGRHGEIFTHLPIGSGDRPENLLAYDGVSCTICHQISAQNLGKPDSFTGGYVVEPRTVFGPYGIDKGLTRLMHSSSEFQPTEGAHIRQSELCATCHTLITKALGPGGEVIGELPEQMMFLEWRHSAYNSEQKSCQSCHMPAVQEETPVASVLGPPRPSLARHVFVGGNAFVLKMLGRYQRELGVSALPHEMTASVDRTVQNLQTATASLSIVRADSSDAWLTVDLEVRNLTGHKLPTAYPARRAWLHVTARDRNGRVVFESGAVERSGRIVGNDNDVDATRFEPHFSEIRRPEDVQIYESVMADAAGMPTTGLLKAVRYLKDNRLLPRGFDKASADANVAVVGQASVDSDFSGGSDRVRYVIDAAGATGPFDIDVELRFQSIGFRWAENLKAFDAAEPKRFNAYYTAMSSVSSEVLAHATTRVP